MQNMTFTDLADLPSNAITAVNSYLGTVNALLLFHKCNLEHNAWLESLSVAKELESHLVTKRYHGMFHHTLLYFISTFHQRVYIQTFLHTYTLYYIFLGSEHNSGTLKGS